MTLLMMDVEILSRIQFALTVSFHYLYPPLSIGLGVLLILMEGMYLWTKEALYHQMAFFWTKIFGLIFAIGVATGVVMEFEFGTNWAAYSRFVGDVFGSALAAEGVFAFFLESGFLAILLFGWDKVPKWLHFFSTCMVCLGAHFSAIWIVVANSWMQTPAGYHIEVHGKIMPPDYLLKAEDFGSARAVIDNFWEMVFNPSSMDRLLHVVLGSWITGACLVLSVSAYYLIKKRHVKFAQSSIKIALAFLGVSICLQGFSGDRSACNVAVHQPAKLAAMEGLFETKPAPGLGIIGWVDTANQKTYALEIPKLLGFLVNKDFTSPVTGLDQFPKSDWPKVNAVYQSYHLMLAMAGLIGFLAVMGIFLWWRGMLFEADHPWVRRYLWFMVLAVGFPQIANQAGWFTAELGRQPWIVYGLMRTSQGLSLKVTSEQVLTSIILFTIIYILLFAAFIYLLHKKIHDGPHLTEQHGLEEGFHLKGSR
jgi:cytochrome d ubiquinol oxidase subunit I